MSNSDANEGPVGEPHQIVIDVDDIDRSAHFWSEVLGLKVSHRWEEYLGFERHKGGLKVVLQIVPEKKTSKNRMHLGRSCGRCRRRLGPCRGLWVV